MASELPPSHQDPDNPYRTLEVCGRIESMDADTDATFYRALQKRYGLDVPVFDADIRVVIVVEPTAFIAVSGDSPTPRPWRSPKPSSNSPRTKARPSS